MSAPRVPEIPETDKVRGLKCVGALLGVDGTTVVRWARDGKLVVVMGTEQDPVPVLYEDHLGFWAPRAYVETWIRAQQRPVMANDAVTRAG